MSQESTPHPPLEIRRATVGYRHHVTPVLRDISLTCAAGTLTHLTGRNGSGKSTLLELCSGYLRPWSGSVSVSGHPAESPSARAHRRVCRTAPALYPAMTVREHLKFACSCVGNPMADALERAARYGLETWLDHEAQELSTGNVRKTWFLMCSIGEADLLVLDEPFNGLDQDAAETLLTELDQWRRTRAIVLIAHQLPVALTPDATVDLDQDLGTT